MVVVFVLVGLAVLAAVVAMQWYGWRRLIRDTTAPRGLARRLGTALFIAGPLLMVAAAVSGRVGFPFWLQRVVSWPGYLWLAFIVYLVLALLVLEAVRPFAVRASRRRVARSQPVSGVSSARAEPRAWSGVAKAPVLAGTGAADAEPEPESDQQPEPDPDPSQAPAPAPDQDPPQDPSQDPSRRLFVSRVLGGTAATLALGTVGYGLSNGLSAPTLKHLTVPLAKLPRRAHGFRIAVVSDIHLGPILGRAHTQRIVDTINATKPDLIAVVGDLVDGTVEDLGPAAQPLARLRSRHGAYFVTGNHEYFSGAEPWLDHVRELGLRPLENARVEIGDFDLAGVNDLQGERDGQGPDFGKALGDRDTARASVLLAHQPVLIDEAVRHGVDLQLSGHTHGGQMWPGNVIADLANPTLAGYERYGDTQLYVSRGAGTWGPPVRVGAPSDITVVTLASRQA